MTCQWVDETASRHPIRCTSPDSTHETGAFWARMPDGTDTHVETWKRLLCERHATVAATLPPGGARDLAWRPSTTADRDRLDPAARQEALW